MIFGITGGSGCGKTTLLNIISEHGGLILDCDKIYHELLENDQEMLRNIQVHFPSAFLDNKLDRKALGSIVFQDPDALSLLNAITHAAVKKEVIRRLISAPTLAAIDAYALFEGGLAELCDTTVLVTAPMEDRIRRLVLRDGISEEYARIRIAAQHTDDWFRQHCRNVLENDSDFESFRQKCVAFLRAYGIISIGNN